jgi:hypothetical protein
MWLEAMESQLMQAHLQRVVVGMIQSRNDSIEGYVQSVQSSDTFNLVNRCLQIAESEC